MGEVVIRDLAFFLPAGRTRGAYLPVLFLFMGFFVFSPRRLDISKVRTSLPNIILIGSGVCVYDPNFTNKLPLRGGSLARFLQSLVYARPYPSLGYVTIGA